MNEEKRAFWREMKNGFAVAALVAEGAVGSSTSISWFAIHVPCAQQRASGREQGRHAGAADAPCTRRSPACTGCRCSTSRGTLASRPRPRCRRSSAPCSCTATGRRGRPGGGTAACEPPPSQARLASAGRSIRRFRVAQRIKRSSIAPWKRRTVSRAAPTRRTSQWGAQPRPTGSYWPHAHPVAPQRRMRGKQCQHILLGDGSAAWKQQSAHP